jgi:hypothetical protein
MLFPDIYHCNNQHSEHISASLSPFFAARSFWLIRCHHEPKKLGLIYKLVRSDLSGIATSYIGITGLR